MDSLSNLPTDDSELDPKQKALMNKYLGSTNTNSGSTSDGDDNSSWTDGNKWKLVGYTTIIFFLLINPWIQQLLTKVPYFGGSDMTVLLLSVIMFAVLTTIVVMIM